MLIALHFNPSQPHQCEHAQWLMAGFKKHNIKFIATNDINFKADVHIISGPHYAKHRWQGHPQVILLDRALYHEKMSSIHYSMDWVSLGWLNGKGGRDFFEGVGRPAPEIKNNAGNEGSIFLADFDGPFDSDADTIRFHPIQSKSDESLLDSLHRHKTAIGYNTTALVTAALEGLDIVCRSEQNIMHQANWLNLLPYADWNYSEIEKGEAWEHLKNALNAELISL